MGGLLGHFDTAHREDGYLVVGFYLQHGATSASQKCWYPSPPGNDWMLVMTCDGRYFEPIWDDLQAPSKSTLNRVSRSPATAPSQGTTSAKNASADLAALGLTPKSIAYLDIEKYTVPAGDTICSPAVRR